MGYLYSTTQKTKFYFFIDHIYFITLKTGLGLLCRFRYRIFNKLYIIDTLNCRGISIFTYVKYWITSTAKKKERRRRRTRATVVRVTIKRTTGVRNFLSTNLHFPTALSVSQTQPHVASVLKQPVRSPPAVCRLAALLLPRLENWKHAVLRPETSDAGTCVVSGRCQCFIHGVFELG